MQCTIHPEAAASTLCANCYRALCSACATRGRDGRICADGCGSRPASPHRLSIAPPSDIARLARLGAATFLMGASGAMLHLAVLALAGYAASFLLLSIALRRRGVARQMA
jgi:hypothetical protein